MQQKWRWWSMVFVALLGCGVALSQVKPESRTLVVNGQTGPAAVVQVNGRTYVDLENLARVANGSLGFRGKQITLTVPSSTPSAQPTTAEAEQRAQPGLSPNFRRAGIETIARLREWGSTLAYAIEHGYGVTEQWAAGYRAQAAQSLSLATAAASTDPDRQALHLLTREFEGVEHWSNNLVQAKKSMDTGKYALSPNALRDDPASQRLMTCGRSLAEMMASGEFKDDPACH